MYAINNIKDLKVEAILTRNIPLMKNIIRYQEHVALLKKYIPDLRIVSRSGLFEHQDYLTDHSSIPGKLLEMVNKVPPVTWISVSLLSEEQIQELIGQEDE